jgi:hypothetical protein
MESVPAPLLIIYGNPNFKMFVVTGLINIAKRYKNVN